MLGELDACVERVGCNVCLANLGELPFTGGTIIAVLPVLLELHAGDDGAEVRRGHEERGFGGAEVSAGPGLRVPLIGLGAGHKTESEPFLVRCCGDFDLKLLPLDLGDWAGDRGEETRGEPGAFTGLTLLALLGLPLLALGAELGSEPARALPGFEPRPGLWEGGLGDVRGG